MTMINWAYSLPTMQERAFAIIAMGHAMAYSNAQRTGESARGTTHFGGPLVMLATMWEMIDGLREVVR